MVFSSLTFLFFFLPIALLLYMISPRKLKNLLLLAVSLFFYAWGEPVYIFLLLFSSIVDYIHGLYIHKYRDTSPSKAKLVLMSSIIVNLGVLTFFKYANFLVENLNQFAGMGIDPLDLPLPIGISFYTFQTMSYSIDVYRGVLRPQKNFITFALYVSLFPQLIAGPIVRYEHIEQVLMHRTFSRSQFAEGVQIFIIGLGKKVLIANSIGSLWQDTQAIGAGELTILAAWLGILAFMLQIYFDFSGYSDMAIGLGKMFGFNFPTNFRYPYIAKSATEFWRRWHITLGAWFRDYLYIPLGGNRKGKLITYRNLFIVWAATGLWHGASWNFMLWGLYFGLILAIEKAGLLNFLKKLPAFFQHLYLLFIVVISWVLFTAEELAHGVTYLKTMFGFGALYDQRFLYDFYTHIVLFIIAGVAATPLWRVIDTSLVQKESNWWAPTRQLIKFTGMLAILLLATAYLVDDSFNPFLYFRF